VPFARAAAQCGRAGGGGGTRLRFGTRIFSHWHPMNAHPTVLALVPNERDARNAAAPGSGIGGVRGATNLPGCRAQLPIGICRIRPRPALRLASACLAWRHVLRFAHGLPPPAQHPLLPPRSHRLRGEWRGACASRGSVSAIGTD
jgi:hypothetical protein